MARVQMSVGNELATELGNDRDAMLKALTERAGVNAYLRGNELTLDGEDGDAVERARSVMEELAQLVAEGVSVGPQTVDAVAGVLTTNGRAVDVLHDVVWMHRGNKVTPKTVGQKRYVDAIRTNTVTFGIGPAGTGKTYLAIALAVAALQEREVARIILTRPAVEAGERLGFLPGDLLAKVDPYLRPLFDALHDMLDAERLASYMDKGMVEVAPLAFMRGRTLNDSFIILDEAQNTSPEQMQMFLTRLGFGSRVVVTGDITQIDLPRDQRSGLVNVMRVLEGVPDISFVRFSDADVVRHKLVQRIVSAYREHAERPARARGVTVAVEVENRARIPSTGTRRAAVLAAAFEAEGVTEAARLGWRWSGARRWRRLNAAHRGQADADRRPVVPARRARAAA